MVSEGEKDLKDNDSNPTDNIKIGEGVGMKLDKRIFYIRI